MIRKAKFLIKEAQLRIKYMTTKDCIFCKIVRGEIPKDFAAKSEATVAFDDINPVAETHILIVPKKHIESIEAVKKEDGQDIANMFLLAQKIIGQKKLNAYRLAFNGGRYQHVPHLHMHLLAGGAIAWNKL